MQLPIDDRILEILSETDLTLSPAVIAENIDKSRHEVNRRLSVLVDAGLADRVKRGYYEITDDGRQYVSGDLDLSNEPDPSE
ncbi:helix-turn-helix domain-containing protein [Haloarculaceae archaeon H-GB2-1]|nr:helix-turn-helix domain-containing protein [Haloarculaceae archaeon H-GB1-1]MEA5408598.1 helix-turn-helix domain-containing protein [Haloarculaceae archaeon H-GB2-1]